jgi:hypothetical protein
VRQTVRRFMWERPSESPATKGPRRTYDVSRDRLTGCSSRGNVGLPRGEASCVVLPVATGRKDTFPIACSINVGFGVGLAEWGSKSTFALQDSESQLSALGHSRHSRHPGVSGSPQERTFWHTSSSPSALPFRCLVSPSPSAPASRG